MIWDIEAWTEPKWIYLLLAVPSEGGVAGGEELIHSFDDCAVIHNSFLCKQTELNAIYIVVSRAR